MNGPALDRVAEAGEPPQVAAQRREAGIVEFPRDAFATLHALLEDGVAAGVWTVERRSDGSLAYTSVAVCHGETLRASVVTDHSTRAGQSE